MKYHEIHIEKPARPHSKWEWSYEIREPEGDLIEKKEGLTTTLEEAINNII